MSKIYILNQKMNLQYQEIEEYIKNLNQIKTKDQIILAPTTLYLDYCKKNTKYEICAQNAYYEDQGAYTGEVSFRQLKSLNINYAIIGHSERRNIFDENNKIINQKLIACLKNKIIPVLCTGESKEERNNNNHLFKIENQIKTSLADTNPEYIIIAYEPIWSIGTKTIPTELELSEMINHIYKIMKTNYHCAFKILYGGSVDENNIKNILKINHIDGVLIGSSSLKMDKITKIVNNQ